MKKKYIPRIIAELRSNKEKKIYQSFKVRCVMRSISVRERILSLISADLKAR